MVRTGKACANCHVWEGAEGWEGEAVRGEKGVGIAEGEAGAEDRGAGGRGEGGVGEVPEGDEPLRARGLAEDEGRRRRTHLVRVPDRTGTVVQPDSSHLLPLPPCLLQDQRDLIVRRRVEEQFG